MRVSFMQKLVYILSHTILIRPICKIITALGKKIKFIRKLAKYCGSV